jgi:hypothetical protein
MNLFRGNRAISTRLVTNPTLTNASSVDPHETSLDWGSSRSPLRGHMRALPTQPLDLLRPSPRLGLSFFRHFATPLHTQPRPHHAISISPPPPRTSFPSHRRHPNILSVLAIWLGISAQTVPVPRHRQHSNIRSVLHIWEGHHRPPAGRPLMTVVLEPVPGSDTRSSIARSSIT